MKRIFCVLFFVIGGSYLLALTPEGILKKVDENVNFKTAVLKMRMEIYLTDQTPRVKIMKAWILSKEKSYVEFLNKEDKNIRYLKLNKQLWIYDKDENNSFLISGHLLKQGMMGSDISYEDALESDEIYGKYNVELIGEDRFNNRECYVLALSAKVKDVSYAKRKMWIDKEYFLPLKEEMYALSGKLLKVFESEDIKSYKNKFYASKTSVSDKLKEGTKTIVSIEEVQFDVPIPDYIFTKRYLER